MAAQKRVRVASPSKGVVVVTPPSAPIQRRRRSSGAVTRRRRSGGTRRRRSAGSSDTGFRNQLLGTAMGGFGFGWLMKHYGNQIPSLPMVGKSGTVAIAAYFFRGKHPVIRDVGVAAAAIAGYSFGKTGAVEGLSEYEED